LLLLKIPNDNVSHFFSVCRSTSLHFFRVQQKTTVIHQLSLYKTQLYVIYFVCLCKIVSYLYVG